MMYADPDAPTEIGDPPTPRGSSNVEISLMPLARLCWALSAVFVASLFLFALLMAGPAALGDGLRLLGRRLQRASPLVLPDYVAGPVLGCLVVLLGCALVSL